MLVSSTLRDLVIGSGLEFDDRGTHQLKGVPGEWHLFAVATLARLLAGRGNFFRQLVGPRLIGLGRRVDSVFDPQVLIRLLGVKRSHIDEFGTVGRRLLDQHIVERGSLRRDALRRSRRPPATGTTRSARAR